MSANKSLCSPKVYKILYTLPLLLLLLLSTSVKAFAETRNIYAGDIITLKITSKDFSSDELRDKFQKFDIIEIKEEQDGYALSLRTFETGEQKVLLGDKEIVINVQSTLNDIQREGIFEVDSRVEEPGVIFKRHILLCVFAIIFGRFCCSVFLIIFRNRKKTAQSPRQLFHSRSGSLSVDDDDYFVKLTFYFKEYIESLHQCRIIGKTSAEIINELKGIQALDSLLPEIRKWLTECDRMKFTGVSVSGETKKEHYERLLELVDKIDTQKEVAA